jgi:citrate lyase beta subunit
MVKVTISPDPRACWIWTGGLDSHGYGAFWLDGKMVGAHKVSYTWFVGDPPEDEQVDHRCRVSTCVNPSHLRPATHQQNVENHSGPTRANTSGVRGVNWHKARKKWVARVKHAGVEYSAGYFADLREAEAAVLELRLKLHTFNDLDREVTAQ